MKNNDTGELWSWSSSTISKYRNPPSFAYKIIIGMLEIAKIGLGLFI